jgi:hypothetical protein
LGNSFYNLPGCEMLSDVRVTHEPLLYMDGIALEQIHPYAFGDCPGLRAVILPPSVYYIDDDAFAFDTPSAPPPPAAIHGYYDSYALWWARQKGYPFYVAPSSGELKANPPGVMYKYIPYEFVAKTRVPDNEGLRFWLEDAAGRPLTLPEGLYLVDGVNAPRADAPEAAVPGTIYGSPLDYTDFEAGVSFTMKARNIGATGENDVFTTAAEFTIKLAPTPDNAWLEAHLNAYPFSADPLYGGDGRLPAEISGLYEDVGDFVTHMEGPFPLFDSFWIDGLKKAASVHYNAEDGSTRVTVLAQTIQDLNNGEHTAAAAFRRVDASADTYADWYAGGLDDKLDVVAQNFTVNLTNRPPAAADPGGAGDTGGDSGGTGGDGGGTGDTGGPGGSGDTGGTDAGNTDDPGDTGGTGTGNTDDPGGAGNPANPTGSANPTSSPRPTNPVDPTGSANPPRPTNSASPTGSANPPNPTNPNDSSGAGSAGDPDDSGETGDSGNSGSFGNFGGTGDPGGMGNAGSANNAGDASNTGNIGNIGGAGNIENIDRLAGTGNAAAPAGAGGVNNPVGVDETDGADIVVTAANNTAAETGGGTAVSGLPVNENGRFYFALDGSGAPFEIRIDIPLEEFENLYFDGALWSAGGDYALRSGSTVLTVTAERLERYDAGAHTLSAEFRSETVEIAFDLIKSAALPEALPAVLPAGEKNNVPAAAIAAGSLVVLLAACGAAMLNAKARRAAK